MLLVLGVRLLTCMCLHLFSTRSARPISSSLALRFFARDLCGPTVTEKHTTMVTRQKQFWVGLSDMQGWRISEPQDSGIASY